MPRLVHALLLLTICFGCTQTPTPGVYIRRQATHTSIRGNLDAVLQVRTDLAARFREWFKQAEAAPDADRAEIETIRAELVAVLGVLEAGVKTLQQCERDARDAVAAEDDAALAAASRKSTETMKDLQPHVDRLRAKLTDEQPAGT
jgi:hypothetical protein